MTRKKYFNLLLICGLHRSGTTYVGRILAHNPDLTVIHEPLNEHFGVVGVLVAYPYVSAVGGSYAKIIDDVAALARPWNRDPSYLSTWGIRRLIYRLTGGKSGLRWSMLRLRKKLDLLPNRLCLKDPFATLATPYLVHSLGAKVVCMIRHPAAIHYSTIKQGWNFDIANLRSQVELIESYGADIPESQWAKAEKFPAASIALLWKMLIRVNSSIADEQGLLMVRHEDLCRAPVAMALKICKHLEIPFTPKMEQFVILNSQGDHVEAKKGKTHDFLRNSKAIPMAWKGQIAQEDLETIQEIAGDEIAAIYKDS